MTTETGDPAQPNEKVDAWRYLKGLRPKSIAFVEFFWICIVWNCQTVLTEPAIFQEYDSITSFTSF